jgi:exosome complex exonuclease DIS3/RRP44
VRFTKSVIASRAALTYKQAQDRIDNAELTDEVTVGEVASLLPCA